MSDRMTRGASERRLEQIREEARLRGRVDGPGVHAAGGPLPVASPEAGYYGTPLLKQPTWTWEVPLYFFVGGAAGAAAIIGAVAQFDPGNRNLVRDARWIAALGGAASGALLTSDLGRPERFLYMLRVFKPQSPMSVGAWTLTTFSTLAGTAALGDLLRGSGDGMFESLGDAAALAAAVAGMAMSTYTGVLIGATTVPVWKHNIRVLPLHFGASAIACGASMLEILGHEHRALNRIAALAAAAETGASIHLHLKKDRELEPLKKGNSGALTTVGAILSGPIPLALRFFGRKSRSLRRLASISQVAGSLLTRYAWTEAGRASAADPAIPLQLSDS